MQAGARFRVPLPSLVQHLGFTVFAVLAYVYKEAFKIGAAGLEATLGGLAMLRTVSFAFSNGLTGALVGGPEGRRRIIEATKRRCALKRAESEKAARRK